MEANLIRNGQYLELRLASVEDAAALLPLWTDDEVTKFTMVADIATEADCEKRIRRQLEWIINDSIGPFVVLDGDRIIGYCGGRKSEDGAYEIFYHIQKAKWGKGYGTEIARRLVRIAFMEKKTRVVRAEAVVENEASWKVLEKVGMTRKAVEKDAFRKGACLRDMYVYEIVMQ